ncbi:uncharacterized protein LOC127569192 [Pristis pectinata]|uniref:uncharacterized protein LOC127569192 n=1 Tax=Pristis pectinata TaxID=685728 RepID=UPI00223DE55E|nr:uncharacterized protein LOC127569192 [Pristis pectinata]
MGTSKAPPAVHTKEIWATGGWSCALLPIWELQPRLIAGSAHSGNGHAMRHTQATPRQPTAPRLIKSQLLPTAIYNVPGNGAAHLPSPVPTALKRSNPCGQFRNNSQSYKRIASRVQPPCKPADHLQPQNQHRDCFLPKGLPALQTHTCNRSVPELSDFCLSEVVQMKGSPAAQVLIYYVDPGGAGVFLPSPHTNTRVVAPPDKLSITNFFPGFSQKLLGTLLDKWENCAETNNPTPSSAGGLDQKKEQRNIGSSILLQII